MFILAAAMTVSPSGAGTPGPEVTRLEEQIALDFLERFGHPYSDVEVLFPEDTQTTARRRFTVGEMMSMLGILGATAADIERVLAAGGVGEFEIEWQPSIMRGYGNQNVLRKDRLACRAVRTGEIPDGHGVFFRVFVRRF
jgi:hypothetical protein